MLKIISYLKVVVLILISSFLFVSSVFIYKLTTKLDSTFTSIDKAVNGLISTENKINQTLDSINDPNPARGTIKLLNKDLVNIKDFIQLASQTAYIVQNTSKKQLVYIDQWNEQLSSTLVHVNNIALNTNLAIKENSKALSESLIQLKPVLQQTTATLKSSQELISNPDLKQSLTNINTTTKAISGMTVETQVWWHETLHPKWPKRVWKIVTGNGVVITKWLTGS